MPPTSRQTADSASPEFETAAYLAAAVTAAYVTCGQDQTGTQAWTKKCFQVKRELGIWGKKGVKCSRTCLIFVKSRICRYAYWPLLNLNVCLGQTVILLPPDYSHTSLRSFILPGRAPTCCTNPLNVSILVNIFK